MGKERYLLSYYTSLIYFGSNWVRYYIDFRQNVCNVCTYKRIHVYWEDQHSRYYMILYTLCTYIRLSNLKYLQQTPKATLIQPPHRTIHPPPSTIHRTYMYLLTIPKCLYGCMSRSCVWAASDSFCINTKQIIWENLYVLYLMYTFACVDMTGRGRWEAHYLCIISRNIKMEREIFNLYLINLNVRQWIYILYNVPTILWCGWTKHTEYKDCGCGLLYCHLKIGIRYTTP